MKKTNSILCVMILICAGMVFYGCLEEGEEGLQGEKGVPGEQGPAGYSCWDLNQNGTDDIDTEDINGDNVVDILDCKGAKGDTGDTGATGPQGPAGTGTGYSLNAADGDPINSVYVDNSGYVGIATTSPDGFLHVVENVGGGSAIIVDGDGVNPNIRFQVDGQDAANIRVRYNQGIHTLQLNPFEILGGSTLTGIVITPSANVGIGTESPSRKLNIVSEDTTSSGVTRVVDIDHITSDTPAEGIGSELALRAENDVGRAQPAGSIQGVLTDLTDHAENGDLHFLTANDGTLGERVTIKNNGRVGIGTDSPEGGLHIKGGYADNALVIEETASGNAAEIVLRNLVRGWAIFSDASPDHFAIYDQTQEEYRFIINDSGNVGIGTQSPTEKLYVSGNIYATGTITQGSSKEFKENISDLSLKDAVDALNRLKPVQFNYKADTEKKDQHIGFIAEDVPDIVATPDRKGLSSMDIVAVLTKVVQDQQEKISALEREISELMNR